MSDHHVHYIKAYIVTVTVIASIGVKGEWSMISLQDYFSFGK